ncbi:MAG: hypothetical protein AB7K68_02570 [Bacteriovoracia bacterium]
MKTLILCGLIFGATLALANEALENEVLAEREDAYEEALDCVSSAMAETSHARMVTVVPNPGAGGVMIHGLRSCFKCQDGWEAAVSYERIAPYLTERGQEMVRHHSKAQKPVESPLVKNCF